MLGVQRGTFAPGAARDTLYSINSIEVEVLAVFVWIIFFTSAAYQIVHAPQLDWYCPSPIKVRNRIHTEMPRRFPP